MNGADVVATLALIASLGVVLWIGIDAWIVTAWLIVAAVLLILSILGRLLARELDIRLRRGHPYPWIAGALAAFISCTMAAGLVRSSAPLPRFWALGLLMALAITSLRLAYHHPRAQVSR